MFAKERLRFSRKKNEYISLTEGRSHLHFQRQSEVVMPQYSSAALLEKKLIDWTRKRQLDDRSSDRRWRFCRLDHQDEDRTMHNAKIGDAFIPRANILKRAPRLGAEIANVRLTAEMSQDVLCAIRQLVREHKVIFFR
ncbi:hypothetical protein [Bradyrhizobium sp. USDA 336]|uniref:hypothetical protein n=1 Tax=Bradyrhizobium sp. USDA 336 TaxID=3156311 RepID=UPI003836B28D